MKKNFCVFYTYITVDEPWLPVDPHFYCDTLKQAEKKIRYVIKTKLKTEYKKENGIHKFKRVGEIWQDIYAFNIIDGNIYVWTYKGTLFSEDGMIFKKAEVRDILKCFKIYGEEMREAYEKDHWPYYLYS